MTKELFIKSIEALQKQYEHDKKCSEALQVVFSAAFSSNLSYNNRFVNNVLLEILQIQMEDNHKDSWIEYYCFELDFGKENNRLKVYGRDKKEIPLKTPEDLWNLLKSNIKENK